MLNPDDAPKLRKELLNRVNNSVPKSVINGSYQAAVNYKAWVLKARKAASDNRSTASELASMINYHESLK